jgi:curved DNA-binding protein CbpA
VQPCQEGQVRVMAAADHAEPGADLYQLLGVSRGASREEIAQAWRRRARDEHPDARPDQAGDGAAGRFRALAEAWQVLSDPGRRAAYDRSLGHSRDAAARPAVPVPVRQVRREDAAGPPSAPGPPLRVGPVRVDGPHPGPAGSREEDEIRLALLAALALRYLARERRRPW